MMRYLAQGNIDSSRLVFKAGRKRFEKLEGSLSVLNTAGEQQEVEFSSMFMLGPERVQKEGGEFINTLARLWPTEVQGRTLRELRDGVTLCDMSAFMRDDTYGIAMLDYGQMVGKWKLRYDENVTCPHRAEGKCPEYCTITIQQFNGPPRRRKKKQREPILSKFKLPALPAHRGLSPA